MRLLWSTAMALLVVTAGCSQIDALAPVGGNTLSEVRFAALDVLHAADVELLTAPVCSTATDGVIECVGTTLADQPIRVSTPSGQPLTMTVTVDGAVVYTGSVAAVLDAAAEGRPLP